jgi:8-amino-7-oxononanoate synthase
MTAMPRPTLIDRLSHAHAERARAGLLRRVRTVTQADGLRVQIGGRSLISFASNDYLGMAQDARILRALQDAANDWGVGATAAHLLGGHRQPHQQLEVEVADWLGYPRALLFSTGMMANMGVLSALLARSDVCVQDKLNHASLIDGARLSGCDLRRYAHADVAAADRQLRSIAGAAALLVTDGVFSMDGDIAPLRELSALCAREQATLMVDDAHGVGVVGAQGRGTVFDAGLGPHDVPLLMLTLGKAIGCFGAVVLGSDRVIEALVQFARSYVYTTAMPPALAAAALQAVRIVREDEARRDQLKMLIARFRQGAGERGLHLMASDTAIQPLLIGSSERATDAAALLEQSGFYVPAIRPPTVPEGAARLRITLSAAHEARDVDGLLEALERALRPV